MLGVRLVEADGLCTAFFAGTCLGVAVSRWTVTVRLWRIEETPSTWRRARSFAEKGAGETWRLGPQKRDLAGFV
jgi:hypothetical protein